MGGEFSRQNMQESDFTDSPRGGGGGHERWRKKSIGENVTHNIYYGGRLFLLMGFDPLPQITVSDCGVYKVIG